jgi:O-antigen/teichoic acid export membrane protein
LPGVGSEVNGAKAWIPLPGGFQIQPAEMAKISIIVGLSLHVILFYVFISRYESKFRFFKFHAIRFESFKRHRDLGVISAISDMSTLDTWLVSKVSNLAESGIYGLALRFRNPFQLSANVVGSRLKPAIAQKDMTSVKRIFHESKNLILVNIFGLILISLSSLVVLPILLPVGYGNLNYAFAIGCISVIFLGISTIAKIAMVALDQENLVKKLTILATLLTLSSVCFGAFLNGALGAVIGYSIMALITSVFDILFIRKIMTRLDLI